MFQPTTHCFPGLVLLNTIIPKFWPSPVSPDISPPCRHCPSIQQSSAELTRGKVTCFRKLLSSCPPQITSWKPLSSGSDVLWAPQPLKNWVINCSGQARGRIDLSFLWAPVFRARVTHLAINHVLPGDICGFTSAVSIALCSQLAIPFIHTDSVDRVSAFSTDCSHGVSSVCGLTGCRV